MTCSIGRGTPKFPTTQLTLQDVTENGNTTTLSIESNAYFLGNGSLLEGVAKDTDLYSNSARISNLENNVIISNSYGITSGFTQGDLIYASADNTLEKLNIGNADQFLKVSTGIPEWNSILLQHVTDDGTDFVITGNIEATSFQGDGSNLYGVPNVERVSDLENAVIISNSSGITTGFTRGDIIYASADNTLNKLSLGDNGKVLKSDGIDVFWGDDVSASDANVGTLQQVTNTGNTTTNVVQFTNSTTSLVTSGNVFIGGILTFPDTINGGLVDLTAPGYTYGTPILTLIPDKKIVYSNDGYLDQATGLEYITETSNLKVYGNIESLSFYGDGTTLDGVALSVDLNDNSLRITNLSSNLDDNSLRITNLSSNLNDNSLRITNLSSNLNDNSLRITNLSSSLDDNSLRITNLSSNLDDNSLRITNLSSNLGDNSLRITTIENNVSTITVINNNTGILNENPQNTLDIGSNIHFNDTDTNKLYIKGDIQNTGIIKTFRLNTTTLFIKNQIVVAEKPTNIFII